MFGPVQRCVPLTGLTGCSKGSVIAQEPVCLSTSCLGLLADLPITKSLLEHTHATLSDDGGSSWGLHPSGLFVHDDAETKVRPALLLFQFNEL